MYSLIQMWKRAWARRPRFRIEDGTQAKSLWAVLRFFAVMLVLTLVARGAAGATLAVVSLTSARQGEIIQSVRAAGNVGANGTSELFAPEGLTVKELFVSAGQTVKAGDSVARFDAEELSETLARAQAKLAQLRLQLEKLGVAEGVDAGARDAAATALARANEDYNAVKGQQDTLVAQAKEQQNAAQQEADALQNTANTLIAEAQRLQETYDAANAALQALQAQTPPADAEALAKAQAEVDAAAAALQQKNAAVQETCAQLEEKNKVLEEKNAAYHEANTIAQNALQNAARGVADAKRMLENAEDSLRKANQEAGFSQQQSAIDTELVRLDIENQQQLVGRLLALQSENGVLRAAKDGTISQLNLAEGDKTSTAPLAQQAGDTQGRVVRFTVPKEEAAKLSIGDIVTVKQDGKNEVQAQLTSFSAPDENKQVTVTAALPENAPFAHNASVEVGVQLSRITYEMCVPPEAVHTDNQGSYVLCLEEENTILGLQNTLRRVNVSIQERGSEKVAIEGPLSPQDKIVETSTKPVSAGASVRVEGS